MKKPHNADPTTRRDPIVHAEGVLPPPGPAVRNRDAAENFVEVTLYVDEILTELRVWDLYFETFSALADQCFARGGDPFGQSHPTAGGDVPYRQFLTMEKGLEDLRLQDWEAYGAELKHAVEVLSLQGEYRLPGPLRVSVDTVTCSDDYDPFDFDDSEIERLVRAAVHEVSTPGSDRPIWDRLLSRNPAPDAPAH